MCKNCESNIKCNSNYFRFAELSCIQVRDVITGLKNRKSCDVFGLSVEILKVTIDKIISPLTILVNACTRKICIPGLSKKGGTTPLYKKGDQDAAENYRPISLLPVFSKVLEKIISIQLCKYFEDNLMYC